MSNKDSVRAKIAEVLSHKMEVIMDDAVLTDLVNNSFMLVEMVIELQEEFDVRFQQADMNEVKTVGALIDLVDSRIAANT
jgi:acyl carrier protein